MKAMKLISSHKMFGGSQRVYAHVSTACHCEMRFSVFLPPAALAGGDALFPALIWLSGLTCTEENFTAKAGAQRMAAELGLIVIAPDTSPRGGNVPDDPSGSYDFGLGAGFYVNATESPWAAHYQMREYIERELVDVITREFPVDLARIGVSGHSMGGHGALTVSLRQPSLFKSVSAFAPIVSPMDCPWGEKALSGYLGADRQIWRAYDACALIEDGARLPEILVDQGLDDQFLEEQLQPERLEAACDRAGIALSLRRHAGYDHSYFFIATYIDDHMTWHAERL